MEEFSAIETIERALQRWWLVALLVICGGGVGWLIHEALPPLYEAKAVFSAAVDFRQSGPITTLEQDKSINVIASTIQAKDLVDQVVSDAQAKGIAVTRVSLLKMTYLERKSEIWELRIRNSNPAVAQTLVNLWADRAFAVLKTDLQHAQRADALEGQLGIISMCIQQAFLPGNPDSLCKNLSPADYTTQYQQVSDALTTERLASGGLAAWLLFDLKQKADLPTQPVTYGANTLVLAGSFIGFILAIWVAAGRLPDRLAGIFARQTARSVDEDEHPSRPGRLRGAIYEIEQPLR